MKKGRIRRQPQRTCIGCRQTGSKRGLLRLVRTPSGEVNVDPTGKAPGRGAYLCADRNCWQRALQQRAIERALKVSLSPQAREALERYANALPEGAAQENDSAAALSADSGGTSG